MTWTAPAAPRSRLARSDRVVVLHVVESWGAGVRAAVLQFVVRDPRARASPAARHPPVGVHGRGRGRIRERRRAAGRCRGGTGRDPSRRRGRRARRRARALRPTPGSTCGPPCAPVPDRRLVYSPHCFAFERRDLSPVIRMLVRAAERVLARNTDTFAACSPAEARAAVQAVAASAAPAVIHVPNVARVPALAMLEHRDPNRVVTVGRIGAQKDPGLLPRGGAAPAPQRPARPRRPLDRRRRRRDRAAAPGAQRHPGQRLAVVVRRRTARSAGRACTCTPRAGRASRSRSSKRSSSACR